MSASNVYRAIRAGGSEFDEPLARGSNRRGAAFPGAVDFQGVPDRIYTDERSRKHMRIAEKRFLKEGLGAFMVATREAAKVPQSTIDFYMKLDPGYTEAVETGVRRPTTNLLLYFSHIVFRNDPVAINLCYSRMARLAGESLVQSRRLTTKRVRELEGFRETPQQIETRRKRNLQQAARRLQRGQ